MLKVTSLKVNLGEEEIIKEVSFSLSEGEIVVLMGPNGSGKSTIAKTLAGHYDYTVTGGNVILDGADITQSEAYERAQAGLFLAFQNPVSLPGVSVTKLLREIKPELATDGAKYLADSADCYWLMNKIAAHNTKDFRTRNPFQVWELFVSGNSGVVRCSDGNSNDLVTEDVEYTDFPISEIKLYAIDDGTWFVILLPGEY